MKEYIEREAAIELGKKQSCAGIIDGGDFCNISANMLRTVPAADVVEVRHARWIKDDETGEPICSVCYSGKPTKSICSSVIEHTLNNHEIRYCYYCGAKMDGGMNDAAD